MHRAKFAALRTSFEELRLLRQEVTDKKYFFWFSLLLFRLLFAFFVIFCWPFVLSCIMASRHHLSDCEKDMVASVHSFFEEENQLGRRLSVRNVRRRTSLACGVSESTVTRCCRRSLGESYYRAMDNVENNEKTHHRCISATEQNEKRSGHDSRSFLFASLQKTGICPVSRLKTLKIHSKSAKNINRAVN